jgi:hypothetical protein
MTDVLSSALFYAGAVTALGGLLSLIRPFHWAGIHTRRRGALLAAAGLALALGATEFPKPTRATAARDTLVDQWLSEWQFGEYHERRVRSSDIFLFRTLTYLRLWKKSRSWTSR